MRLAVSFLGLGVLFPLMLACCARSGSKASSVATMPASASGAVPASELDGDEHGSSVRGFAIRSLDMKLEVEPGDEHLRVSVRMKLDNGELRSKLRFLLTRPTRIERALVVEGKRSTKAACSFETSPKLPWRSVMTLTVKRPTRVMHLLLEYRYDRKAFAGFAQNPSTLDNLHLGQLRRTSVYSSHLLYYPRHLPQENGFLERARLSITCQKPWVAVSSGRLVSITADQDPKKRTYTYAMGVSSGRLPYPLAVFPYETRSMRYGGRVEVTIYHAPADAAFAKEKLNVIATRILPFLEKLMGPFPYPRLRIVEVFPWEGNTGLAARGLVMLSQKGWFAAPIRGDLTSKPALVLVDEIAHQWNFYKIKLPNYLAEGVSEFTDILFLEHAVGRKAYEDKIARYAAAYSRIARLLNILKELKKTKGLSLAQAASALKLEPAVIAPFWKSADHGETAISSPRAFAALYFIKGTLALHALRQELSDSVFFRGFRGLFATRGRGKPLTLEGFLRPFELVSHKRLDGFKKRWYLEPGLPKVEPPRRSRDGPRAPVRPADS